MKKLRIYFDTSIISFVYADDAPQYQQATVDLLNNYISDFEVFVSEVVLAEIEKTSDAKLRSQLFDVFKRFPIVVLSRTIDQEISGLANEYISRNIVPKKKYEDALHIAFATAEQMDVLLSWNFKHLANLNKQMLIGNANRLMGYLHPLNLLTPLEVMDDEWSI